MLTVTEAARNRLRDTLLANTDNPEDCLRLMIKPPGQMGLVLDKVSPSDGVVEHEGLTILAMSQEISDMLEGAKLDVEETPDGGKLKLYPQE